MTRLLATALFASLAFACGPEIDDADPEAPGELVYDDSFTRMYRLERRMDLFERINGADRHECGMLTERAYTELLDTLAALDPAEDYGHPPEDQQCDPGALIHVEGFEHSPFECDFQCCRPELIRVAFVYWLVGMHFSGYDPLEFDGEPYVAIDPDEPCP